MSHIKNFVLLSVAAAFFLFVHFHAVQADTAAQTSAQAVFAQFKAASGGAAWDSVTDFVTTSNIEQGGLKGTDENWANVTTGQYCDHYSLGGASGSDGYDGSRSWAADTSGIAKYLDSLDDSSNARTNAYLISMAYWYPDRLAATVTGVHSALDNGKSCTVVSVSPDGGYPIDLWFENDSSLLVRTVVTTSSHTMTSSFGEFRVVDGVTLPYTTLISTGDPKFDLKITVTEELVNQPVLQSVFQKPGESAIDYTIVGGAWPITVPFTYSIGHIYVPVKIDGRGPFLAILDTGGRLAFSPEFARQNRFDSEGRLPGTGTGSETVRTGIGKISTLSIGDITISNQTAIVLPMPTSNPLIGNEIFSRFAVRIDFDKQLLTLTPLSTFIYSGSGVAAPFRFHNDIPEVDGVLDGIPGSFMIDTGSGNSLDLFQAFSEANSLAAKYHPPFTANGGFGIGGAQTVAVARADRFTIGPVGADKLLIFLSNASAGSFADKTVSGNVGTGFLHRFNLTFDYARQQIYFEPNSFNNEFDSYERLGITIFVTNDGCKVIEVIPGSPAAEAGIAAGDDIKSVNGRRLGATDGAWFEDQMHQPAGTTLTLTFQHNGKTQQTIVTLRDLI